VSAEATAQSVRLKASYEQQPMVSIIIPCYNCVSFIRDAIESALAQTWMNVEVLVVDDGSDDGSTEIITSLPVRYIRSDHGGVAAARNLGVMESRGEFIIFLDADDRLLPHAAEVGLLALLANPNSCISVGAHNLITETGEFIRLRTKPLRGNEHYSTLLRSNFIECIAAVLYRRDLFLESGGFNVQLLVSEDYDLYLRLSYRYPIICHRAIIAEYRQHGNNISRRSSLMLVNTLRVLQSQRPYAFSTLNRFVCYLSGNWLWRRKYGHQLIREISMRGSKPDGPELRTLARLYPPGILILLLMRLLPRAATSAILCWLNRDETKYASRPLTLSRSR
jgi:glycosyltransferase involved in cell wall biosynthesis